MKTLYMLLLIAAFLIPGVVSADTDSESGRTYIFRTTNHTPIDIFTDTACVPAFPIIPGGVVDGVRADLYSLSTRSSDSSVVNEEIKKVGELIACTGYPYWDWFTETTISGATLNVNVLYFISIDDQNYVAAGSGRWRTEIGFLGGDSSLLGATATVARIVEGVPIIVGSYTGNILSGGEVDGLKTGSISVLRIFNPPSE